MSELTSCNYCSHQRNLVRAKKLGMKITVLSNDFGLGGVSVFTHPKTVDVKKLSEKEREPYRGSWFMELPDHCCC